MTTSTSFVRSGGVINYSFLCHFFVMNLYVIKLDKTCAALFFRAPKNTKTKL
jgi:hypothetical protein